LETLATLFLATLSNQREKIGKPPTRTTSMGHLRRDAAKTAQKGWGFFATFRDHKVSITASRAIMA
jgi:hypothetical protein